MPKKLVQSEKEGSKLETFLKSLDFFGEPVQLKLEGKHKLNSSCGGALSIAFLLSALLIICNSFAFVILGSKPGAITTQERLLYSSADLRINDIDISSIDLRFGFIRQRAVQQANVTFSQSIGQFILHKVVSETDIEGSISISIENSAAGTPLEACNDDVSEWDVSAAGEDSASLFCSSSPLSIYGDTSTEKFAFYTVTFRPCEGVETCASADQISEFLA